MAQMSMADLLAKETKKLVKLTRGQEIEGEIIAISGDAVILDLGAKSEGVLYKKDFPPEQASKLQIGDKLTAFVIIAENESGQVVLGLHRASSKTGASARFNRFIDAQNNNQVLKGRGLEVNKGGLIVEVAGVRGFLPASQVALEQANNLDELVGKEISVKVIEVDPAQNRLIFSQQVHLSEEVKQKLELVKAGDELSGEVAGILPFGLFVRLENGLEGFVHVSELSWEKVEDPSVLYQPGDQIKARVSSVDLVAGRVNLSIKQLQQDPFAKLASTLQSDDVVKGTVTKITPNGIMVNLQDNLEAILPSQKLEPDSTYQIGQTTNFLIDTVDLNRRRITLSPFITSTKDLIYK